MFNSKIRRRWSIRNWSRILLIALLVTNFDHCGGSCWYTVSEFHTVLKNIICWNSYRVPYFLRIKKYLPIFPMQKIFTNQDFAWEEILESRSFDKALEKKLLEILSQINFQSKIFEKVFQRPWSSDFQSFCHYFYLYFFSLFKFIYLFKDWVSNADPKHRYFGGRSVHKLAVFGQLWSTKTFTQKHCVKRVRIRSYSGPHFSAFELNTERYRVSLRIQSQCWKMPTRITPNTDTFYAKFSILRLFMRTNIPKKCVLESLTKIYQALDISATLVKCFSATGAKITSLISFICLNLMLRSFSIASKSCIIQISENK